MAGQESAPEPNGKGGEAPPAAKRPKIRVSLTRKVAKGRNGTVQQCISLPVELHRTGSIYVVAKGLHGEEPHEFSGLVGKGIEKVMREEPVSPEWAAEARTAIEEADREKAAKGGKKA